MPRIAPTTETGAKLAVMTDAAANRAHLLMSLVGTERPVFTFGDEQHGVPATLPKIIVDRGRAVTQTTRSKPIYLGQQTDEGLGRYARIEERKSGVVAVLASVLSREIKLDPYSINRQQGSLAVVHYTGGPGGRNLERASDPEVDVTISSSMSQLAGSEAQVTTSIRHFNSVLTTLEVMEFVGTSPAVKAGRRLAD